jgi:hypothetical protein
MACSAGSGPASDGSFLITQKTQLKQFCCRNGCYLSEAIVLVGDGLVIGGIFVDTIARDLSPFRAA